MKLVNIMPMSGKGKRFMVEGISIPKPFIRINNKPMFIKAFRSMPRANSNYFICYEKHLNNIDINYYLKKNNISNYKVLKVKKFTKGQAETVFIATKYLSNDDQIFINSCDNEINFDKKKYNEIIKKKDIIIFTSKPSKYQIENYKSFGWVASNNKKILKITCKDRASKNPKNDQIIIGTFAFRNKLLYEKLYKEMIKTQKIVNKEYYIDSLVSLALQRNFSIYQMSVLNYNSWGTPFELKEFYNNQIE